LPAFVILPNVLACASLSRDIHGRHPSMSGHEWTNEDFLWRSRIARQCPTDESIGVTMAHCVF
jgi:hypothetical protein